MTAIEDLLQDGSSFSFLVNSDCISTQYHVLGWCRNDEDSNYSLCLNLLAQ